MAVMALLALTLSSVAQTEEELLTQLIEEERSSVEALVLYPDDTRMDILEASKYPEALVKIESMQNKTSSSFKRLMENYPREIQEKVWDMTRYPGLISGLVSGGPKSGSELEQVLLTYPEEIRARAREIHNTHFSLLTSMDEMNRDWDNTFRELVREYPIKTQDALHSLVNLPEVLTLLTDNIRMTVLVGDLYRRRPEWLFGQMDSLNVVVAEQRSNELNDWKTNLDENPQAREELIQSAQTFAGEYGYDDAYYDYGDDIYYSEDRGPEEVTVEHHYYHHYPFWYGYPYWYMYPRWRPYPIWWDWGFYWGPGRVVVIVDLPSYYFTNWYFYRPYHHYNYPHFSSCMVNHYYGHRHSSSSVSVTVNNWRTDNRDIVSDEWLETSRRRPDNFREYGKFEDAREKYNHDHPDKPMDRRTYAENNKRKYPELAKVAEQQKQREQTERQQTRPAPKPRVPAKEQERTRIEPRKDEPPVQKRPEVQPPRTKDPVKQLPKTETQPTERKKNEGDTRQKQAPADIPKVDRARDYHRNTWEKNKTERQRTESKPAITPAPRTKAPATQKTQPKTKTAPRKKGGGNQE